MALELIGKGGNKEVFAIDEHTVRLVPRLNLDDDDLYGMYLIQKIAYVLFPENVPNALSTGRDKQGKGYIDVERRSPDAFNEHTQYWYGVEGAHPDKRHNAHEVQHYERVHNSEEGKAKRMEFIQKMHAVGFKDAEASGMNFSYHDKKLTYYDFGPTWRNITFDPKLLKKAISNIDDRERRKEAQTLYKELMKNTSTIRRSWRKIFL